MYGVFDKAGEQLKKGKDEQEFDSIRDAVKFWDEYAAKVKARDVTDYDVLDLATFTKVA